MEKRREKRVHVPGRKKERGELVVNDGAMKDGWSASETTTIHSELRTNICPTCPRLV